MVVVRRLSDSEALSRAVTPRQMEILRSRAWGLPNKAIAYQLGLNEHTVKVHTTAAYQRLGVSGLVDALRALGWLRVPAR